MPISRTSLPVNPVVGNDSDYVDKVVIRSGMGPEAISALLSVKGSPMERYSGLLWDILRKIGESAAGFDSRLCGWAFPAFPLSVMGVENPGLGKVGIIADMALMAVEHLDPEEMMGWDRACVLHLKARLGTEEGPLWARVSYFVTFDRFNILSDRPIFRKDLRGPSVSDMDSVEAFLSDSDVVRWVADGKAPSNDASEGIADFEDSGKGRHSHE